MRKQPEKPATTKPATREEILRELIGSLKFFILNKGNPVAEGYIVNVLNTNVVMVDLWRNDDENTTTTHFYQLDQMGWDEVSQTGFMFGHQHRLAPEDR